MVILRSWYPKCCTASFFWRSLVLCAIAQQFNSLVTSHASSSISYKAGRLTNAAINVMGNNLGGEIGGHLNWLANSVELFTFPGHDGLLLQGYHIPAPSNLNHNRPSSPVLIHCAGWSETTIKYSKFLRILHGQGYSIYSFDLRGQGFSSPTGFDKGVVTHVRSFKEYVDDLEIFVAREVAQKIASTKSPEISAPAAEERFIYVANSMAALVGLTLQARTPVFERLALVAPCIKPLGVPLPARAVIGFVNKIGLGSSLLVRLPRDISNLKITHCPVNGKAWRDLRDLVPERLVVQGPSVSFMRELVTAAKNIRKVGGSITADVLILQAGIETFVENSAMGSFFSSLGSKTAKLVRFSDAYHEILMETPDLFSEAVDLILKFIAQSPSPSGASNGTTTAISPSVADSSALSYLLDL